ncbi:MAG: tRNA guanosine(34) transglycosylase Tgt [Phycisphaerales bacterium]
MSALRFEISHHSASCLARCGRVETPHGSFETPAFMPVGTRAAVKGLLPDMVRRTGAEIILNNTYHLMLRPGSDLIKRRGGVHEFMRWDGPILTDSGGFQVFSMSDINRIDDDGVVFRSIIDGSLVELTPERSIAVQNELGADIIMAFDDCPPAVDPKLFEQKRERLGDAGLKKPRGAREYRDHEARLDAANERTVRWLERCIGAHRRPDHQALFGIVQGGTNLDKRSWCVDRICSFDLPGFAIGGVAVGEGPEQIALVVGHTAPLLPVDKPRYLMGVGYEWDLLTAIRAGVDMFDCVLPTRNGRNGNAFTPNGQMRLKNARFAEDDRPIDETCDCPVCAGGYSRAYLRHLFLAGEMLGPILVSWHNIAHFQRLMVDIRRAVREDDWSSLTDRWPVLGQRGAAPDSGERAGRGDGG